MPLIQLGGVREDQAEESIGQKRGSPSHSSKNAAKEKMGQRFFFSATKRAERLCGRDVKMVFSLLLEGSMFQANFQRKRVSLAFSFSLQKFFQVLDS